MIEKENNEEKELVERLKREIKAEFKKEKGGARRTAGLIMSGVGGIIYLIPGFMYLILSLGYGSSYYSTITFPLLIAGAISIIGTIVGLSEIKIGGIIIVSAIPISLVIGIILVLLGSYYWYNVFNMFFTLLLPLPFPHSIHVVAGGILCLTGSDKVDKRT